MGMRNKRILAVLFAIVLILICCKKNTIDKFGVTDFSHSACKNSMNKSTNTQETITLESINIEEIRINHNNTIFNCCPGKLVANAKIITDTIIIDESATESTCNCICPYDFEFTIGKLEYGNYVFILRKDNFDYSKFAIDFNKDTDTTIIIQ